MLVKDLGFFIPLNVVGLHLEAIPGDSDSMNLGGSAVLQRFEDVAGPRGLVSLGEAHWGSPATLPQDSATPSPSLSLVSVSCLCHPYLLLSSGLLVPFSPERGSHVFI